MEPDLLRIILIIFALVSIFSIYAWDRMRRRTQAESEVMTGFHADSPDILQDEAASTPEQASNDVLGKVALPSTQASSKQAATKKPLPSFSGKKVFPGVKSPQLVSAAKTAPEPPRVAAEPAMPALEKIIALSIVAAKGQTLEGKRIMRAVHNEDMHFGEMKIFHRLDENKDVLFSLVNMVEPGYFDLETIEQAHTPGVTFFMRLPGSKDSMAMFSNMLFTVERFSATLQGQVVNQKRAPLNKDMLTELQDEIVQFDHEVRMRLVPTVLSSNG